MANIIPVVLSIIIALTLALTSNIWTPLEQKAYDCRLKIIKLLGMDRSKPSGMIIVVGMEENDIRKEKPLIFWYPDIGKFLLKMKEYNVKVVGLDMIPIHSLGQKIKNAAQSIKELEFNKASDQFLVELGQAADNALIRPLVETSNGIHFVQAITPEHFPFYYSLLSFMKNVTVASTNLIPDEDKIIRKQWLTERGRPDAFSYALYHRVTGKRTDTDLIFVNYLLLENIPYYSFRDVMAGKVDKQVFAGKAVILGYISKSEDIHPTPLSYVSGTMLQAATLETLLSNKLFKELNDVLWICLLFVFTGIGYMVSVSWNPVRSLLVIFAVTAAYLIINLLLLLNGYILPVFPHVLSPLLLFMTIYPYRYVTEERYRRKIYKTFSYYVDPRMLKDLIEKNPESLLTGETREMCVLFLDIRNFSMLSQTCDAKQLVSFLNIFFAAITEIIQRHQGFLNKFLGDGLLAFFSIGQNHVSDAVQASREIIIEINKMNETGRFSPFIGDWVINIGIGIHFGKVVMGNVGSEKKMDFTVIGNTVNLASRIEGLTKEHNKSLLLSESAYEMVKNDYQFEWLGASKVKGFEEPINVYALKE